MKALRIKVTQSKASYSREETVNNRMTYPLPPFSTVIGAIHNACGYTDYHNMEISVQGKYESMQKEIFVNHTLLNNLSDDRGSLIWLSNPNFFNDGFITVGEAINAQGNSFENDITVRTIDVNLINEYRRLKGLSKSFENEKKVDLDEVEKEWKAEKNKLKALLEKLGKKSDEWLKINEKISLGDKNLKCIKEEFKKQKFLKVEEPLSHFKTLTKGPQTQEVLYDVELLIHVKADDGVLQDIIDNQHNLISLGRSEDFISLEEIKLVDIENSVDHDVVLPKNYTMYIDVNKVGNEEYFQKTDNGRIPANGTVYYLAKDYKIIKGKRIFNRLACLYSSNFYIDSESEDIGWDSDGDYIVNFN